MTDIMGVGGALPGLADMAMTSRCDLLVTVLRCLSGAFLGLAIGMVSSWLILETVVRSWETQLGALSIHFPAPTNDEHRVAALIFYVIPLAFATVGAGTAYYLCMAGAP